MKAKVDSGNGSRSEVFSSCPNSTRAIACPRRLSGPRFQPPAPKEKLGAERKPGRAAVTQTTNSLTQIRVKFASCCFFVPRSQYFDRTSEGNMKMPSKNKNAVISYVLRKHGRIQLEMLLLIVLSRIVKILSLLEDKDQVNSTRNFNERFGLKRPGSFITPFPFLTFLVFVAINQDSIQGQGEILLVTSSY